MNGDDLPPPAALAAVNGADLPLPALTQEELAAAGAGGAVALPLLDGLSAGAHRAAVDAGRRSLLARGLLAADGTPAAPLRAVVALRRSPGARLVADRGDAVVWCHVAPTRPAVLEERPGPDGVHRFSLRWPERAAAAHARFAAPTRSGAAAPPRAAPPRSPESRAADLAAHAAGYAGPHPHIHPPPGTDAGRAIASATAVTRVAAARPGPVTAAVTVADGPLGTWVVVAGDDAAHAHPVDGVALVELFGLLLALPYIDSGAVTPSRPSPTTRPSRAASTSQSRADVSSGGTPSPIT